MDDDQQFCLRWNNHQSTLISVFDTLLENGTLVDCTLAAEGKFLKAHKVVLSACSPYFAALLSQQYDKHPIFILKDVKFQELRAMMDYMYRGEVNISQDQLAALLKAAESLQIKGLSDNRNNSMSNKTDNIVKPPPPPPVPASALKGGLVASDMKSTIPREGSTSPSRKRKKIGRRRSIGDANNVLDNHEHSNSSSHSHTTPHIAAAVNAIAAVAVGNNNIATSTPIVLPVTKKTDHDQNKTADAAGIDGNSTIETLDEIRGKSVNDGKRNTTSINEGSETHSELMIEPKNEYEEEDDDDGNEPVEDLTLDDEEMMEDMDQAGPSHGGEGSSSGYANWQMERSGDEGFMVGQDGGQQRDAQGGEEDGSLSLVVRKKSGGMNTPPTPDDQPCDLRLLTPSINLRELSTTSSNTTSPITPPSNTNANIQLPLFSGSNSAIGGNDGISGSSSVLTNAAVNLLSSHLMTGNTSTAFTCKRCGNSYARPHSLNRQFL